MALATPAAPSVELDGVSVSFGGLQALKDVSFQVSNGEIVGLIGPNGAGKTTVFNVVCGFVRPTSGHVRFPAAGRSNLRPSQLARAGVSRTLQGVGLLPALSVLENVMAGGQIRPYGGFFTSLSPCPGGPRRPRAARATPSRCSSGWASRRSRARCPSRDPLRRVEEGRGRARAHVRADAPAARRAGVRARRGGARGLRRAHRRAAQRDGASCSSSTTWASSCRSSIDSSSSTSAR